MERLTPSEELKAHTKEPHAALEKKLIPLIQSVSTRSQYAKLLQLFYGFYRPLESRLHAVPGIENITAGIPLRKADSLRKDIVALHAQTDNLILCSDLPECANLSRAMGILYVLEGSVLGGTVIASILTRKLAGQLPLPLGFFLFYGDEAKPMWNRFKANIDSAENLLKTDILSGATDTFVLFKKWIGKNGSFFSPLVIPK